jgi:hypothetical protein
LEPAWPSKSVVGRGAEGVDVVHPVFAADDGGEALAGGDRHLERAAGVGGDPLVDLAGVFVPDGFPVAVIPPVLDAVPRPFGNVEDVVTEARHAAVHADVNAPDGRAHEGDRHDADDHAERRQRRPQLVRPDLRGGDADGLTELV